MTDELLEKAVRAIAGHEREILDQFAKAFVAAKSLQTEIDLVWLLTHLQLNRQDTFQDGIAGVKYWFSFHDDNYKNS